MANTSTWRAPNKEESASPATEPDLHSRRTATYETVKDLMEAITIIRDVESIAPSVKEMLCRYIDGRICNITYKFKGHSNEGYRGYNKAY